MVVPDVETCGWPSFTPANGAGWALGVTAAATYGPNDHVKSRSAPALIHSPCHAPWRQRVHEPDAPGACAS